MWNIITRDNKEVLIDNEEYQGISDVLGKAKLFKLKNGTIINSSDIKRIEVVVERQPIPKEYRLPDFGGTNKEERIRVPGGWQTINQRNEMRKLFNKMKENGIFKEFKSYEDWEVATYKDDMEKAKEFAGQKKN